MKLFERRSVRCASLVVSAIVWSYIFESFFVALAILVGIIVHELGHWMVLKGFRYEPRFMIITPLGGAVVGNEFPRDPWHWGWVSLGGSLTTLAFGYVILGGYFTFRVGYPDSMEWLKIYAHFIALGSLYNLMPIAITDGGHFLITVLMGRKNRLVYWVLLLLNIITCVAIAIDLQLYSWYMILFQLFILFKGCQLIRKLSFPRHFFLMDFRCKVTLLLVFTYILGGFLGLLILTS